MPEEEIVGGWAAWRNYVLPELTRINGTLEKLADSDVEIRIDVSNLKFAAAIIGATAGIGGSVAAMLVYFALTTLGGAG